ncbi:MAG: hypothetical protein ACR2PT_06205 [Endozoicomonas sp.]
MSAKKLQSENLGIPGNTPAITKQVVSDTCAFVINFADRFPVIFPEHTWRVETMNLSVTCLTAPVARGISDAGDAVKLAVDSCRKNGRRVIGQIGGNIEHYSQQFKAEHPVATRHLKTFGDYVVKAARATCDGIQATAREAVSIHNRITRKVQAAKQFVETRCPRVAIAMRTLSEFTLHPIANALKGVGVGAAVFLAGQVISSGLMMPYQMPLLLSGMAVGAAYGLAKAALNSARYTLKLEGAEQHPYLAKAVSLCDRVLNPIKKADRFLEGLHPALSIPYKALKECAVAAVNIPTIWSVGVIGIVTLENAVNGLSYDFIDTAITGTFFGGIALGVAKPVWDTGKFAYRRIREHMQLKEPQPVVRLFDEPEPAFMV